LAESDADRLKTDAAPVHLDRLLYQAIEMFEGVAEERGVAIEVGEVATVSIAGNRHHLRQVLNNLLDNAIKFTAERFAAAPTADSASSGKVTVVLKRDEQAGRCELRIHDNGVGISTADLPHIFDRFYRVDKSRSRDALAGGTGLGLSICRAIVEAHQGTIRATSELEHGTTFIVSLPLAATAQVSAHRANATDTVRA
jgi:signal transduction histidine kinase